MRTYTLDELNKLALIRLKGFEEQESFDDMYINDFWNFEKNLTIFMEWLAKMESQNKIDFLINEYDKCKLNQ